MRDGSHGLSGRLMASILIAGLLATGCQRSGPGLVSYGTSAFGLPASGWGPTVQPAYPSEQGAALPGAPAAGSQVDTGSKPAPVEPNVAELLRGLVNDLPAMARQLDGQSYQIQVVPRSSQDKADRVAWNWASDAQQIYVIWAYWKLPALSITRHAYYSPSKGKALKVEFTLSSLFDKSYEEPAEGFDQASLVLNEARDRYAYEVKEAHAIARNMGYVPNKYGAAVLLVTKTHGPLWVFADMPSQTEGKPVMLVNAASGMVTQGGEAMLLAKYLFQRAGY
jgi:hypothetical protein